MTKEFIIKHLVTRDFWGYNVTDPIYKKQRSLLTKQLSEYLGSFNLITTGIYN